MYRCAICGKEYEDAEAYVECSRRCMQKLNIEKERKRKEKLETEKEARYKEIVSLKDKIDSDKKMLDSLKVKYIEDYPDDARLGFADFVDCLFYKRWW